jgi:hypothetical protein
MEKSNINFINWYAKEPQRDAPIGKALFINKVLPSHRLNSTQFSAAFELKLFIKNFFQMMSKPEYKTNLYLAFKICYHK